MPNDHMLILTPVYPYDELSQALCAGQERIVITRVDSAGESPASAQ